MQIVYSEPEGQGYQPLRYMVTLAADLFGARLTILPAGASPGRLSKLAGLLPRRGGGETLLLVCASPPRLQAIFMLAGQRRFARVVAWVFDSFWVDFIPRINRIARPFDHVFVTELEDLDAWQRALGVPVSWLPWGSDALRLGSSAAERPVDLQRVGRQPETWESDAETARACRASGLVFGGRPTLHDDGTDNERELMAAFGRAKFTLSFSNRVSPGVQTHPTREYITARWVDALAAGAVVAGVPPRCPSAQELLWPEALLDLGTVERALGLERLAGAVRVWTPQRAGLNARRALERLDWRWRFGTIAEALGEKPARLLGELDLIRRQLEPVVGAGR